VLLAGDAAHSAAELHEVAPILAAWCRSEGITVLTAHDRAAGALLG
jgi:hypothetical protein